MLELAEICPLSWESTCCANACILDSLRFLVVMEQVLLHVFAALAFAFLAVEHVDDSASFVTSTNPASASIAYNLAFSALNSRTSSSTSPPFCVVSACCALSCLTHASKDDTVSSSVLM